MKKETQDRWIQCDVSHLQKEPGQNWFLVRVTEKSELKLAKYCGLHSIRFFFSNFGPLSGIEPRIAWPGYIFCSLSPETRHLIEKENYVVEVQRLANEDRFLIDMQRILKQEESKPSLSSVKHLYSPGDWLRIQEGPLAEYYGTFLKYTDKRKKVIVSVHMLGIPIEATIDTHAIEPNKDRSIMLLTYEVLQKAQDEISIALAPINEHLIRHLADRPQLLYELNPRRFEELVAKLLTDMGYEVELTPPTHDGGRDILAVLKIPLGEILTVVDCKRYSHDRRIGPDIVRQLLWVAERRDNASRAMIATTTFFTSGARDLEREYRWRLTLSDFNDLISWLSKYGKWVNDKSTGLWLPRNKVVQSSADISKSPSSDTSHQ